MAPGARHEVLNDQWGGWNFRKLVSLSKLFPLTFHRVLNYPRTQGFSFSRG